MKLTNRTHYSTEHLRAFFSAGLRHMEAASAGKIVEVVYTRPGDWRRSQGYAGYISGCASLGHWRRSTNADGEPIRRHVDGRRITMRLPKGGPLNLALLARVWEHEVLHTQGVRHRSMGPAIRHPNGTPDAPLPAWAEGLEVPASVAAPVVPLEERRAALVAKREEHARAKLAEYEAKAKRVARLAAKWRAKVRGYERRAAARAK